MKPNKVYSYISYAIGVPCAILSAVTNGIAIQKILIDLGVPIPNDVWGRVVCFILDFLIIEVSIAFMLFVFFTACRVIWTVFVRDFYDRIPKSLLNYLRFNSIAIVFVFGLFISALTYVSYHMSQNGGNVHLKEVNHVVDMQAETERIHNAQKKENKRIDTRFSNDKINLRLAAITKELVPINKDLTYCKNVGKICTTVKNRKKELIKEKGQLLKDKAHNNNQITIQRTTNNTATASALNGLEENYIKQKKELEHDIFIKKTVVISFTIIMVFIIFMGAIVNDNKYFKDAVKQIRERIKTYNEERESIARLGNMARELKPKVVPTKAKFNIDLAKKPKAPPIVDVPKQECTQEREEIVKEIPKPQPEPPKEPKEELPEKNGVGVVKPVVKVQKVKEIITMKKDEKLFQWFKAETIKKGKMPAARGLKKCIHCSYTSPDTLNRKKKAFIERLKEEGIEV